jgi:GT2 family glycosyltransferase
MAGTPVTAPRVSVVIPTYRRRALVERALRSLAQQTLPPEQYEVIVAIDGSEDGTRELVGQFSAPYPVRALWQPNRGRAAACNAGARAATGEILVLLDDDMEAAPGLLAAHIGAHPVGSSVGVVGAVPVVDLESRTAQFIAARFERHAAKLQQADYSLKLRDFYSGSFSIRRDVFWAVGGFDEAFRIYGNEDLELALRLRRAGVRIIFRPEAIAYQRYTKSIGDLARDNLAKGRTAVLLATKHPEALQELRLATDDYGTPVWRRIRRGLLALSIAWPGTPELVIRLLAALDRYSPRRLDLCVTLALDYLYWHGAEMAVRESSLGHQTRVPVAPHRPGSAEAR